jgi:hypothetical protein
MIKINKSILSDDSHLFSTDRGWINAEQLQKGDKILAIKGESVTIKNILKCGKRPDAPIVGELK